MARSSTTFIKGHKGYKYWLGKIIPKEAREKMSLAKLGKPSTFLGKKHSKESKQKNREAHLGAKSHFWKGGITKMKGYDGFKVRKRLLKKQNNGGSHTLIEWETLKAQYNWTCPCCNKSEPKIKLTEDHIIPLSKGGSDNIENIQPLCKSCNSHKYTKIIKY